MKASIEKLFLMLVREREIGGESCGMLHIHIDTW